MKASDMPETSRSDFLFVFCLIAVLTLLAVWLEGCLRRRQFSRPGSEPAPRMLCWLAYRRRITIMLCLPAVPGSLFLLSMHYGGMSPGAALWSMAVIWGIVLVAALPALQVQRRLIRSALKRFGEFLPMRSGVKLAFAGASWVYSDADWLICVGGGSSALIYAPGIDFARPAQLRPYIISTSSAKGPGFKMNAQPIVLFTHDGGECMLLMARAGMFSK